MNLESTKLNILKDKTNIDADQLELINLKNITLQIGKKYSYITSSGFSDQKEILEIVSMNLNTVSYKINDNMHTVNISEFRSKFQDTKFTEID
jgi:hypothetical protein